MLKRIHYNLTPEIYSALYMMGHGDELVITDGNFPAESHARNLIKVFNANTVDILKLVLEYIPLDTFVESPVNLMKVVRGDNYVPEVWDEYYNVIFGMNKTNRQMNIIKYIDRNEFYIKTKRAHTVIFTKDTRRYANIIIKKGIIEDWNNI